MSFTSLVCLFVIVFQQPGSELVVESSKQDNHVGFHRIFSNISRFLNQESIWPWWNSSKNMYCKKFYETIPAFKSIDCKWDFKDQLSSCCFLLQCHSQKLSVSLIKNDRPCLVFGLQVKCLVGFELFDWCHAVSYYHDFGCRVY